MDEAIVQQMLDELLSSFEPLEARSMALLQFMKAKGIATDEELAPFLEQAGNTSNIRWRVVRVRMAALISSAMKPAEQSVSAAEKTQPVAKSSPETSEENTEKETAQKKEVKKKEPEPDFQRTSKKGDASSKAGEATVSKDENNKGSNELASPQQKPASDNAKDTAKDDSG